MDQNIVIGKPPASTMETTQPCDSRHCFICPKTALKEINDCNLIGKDWMQNSLGNIFKEHKDSRLNINIFAKQLIPISR